MHRYSCGRGHHSVVRPVRLFCHLHAGWQPHLIRAFGAPSLTQIVVDSYVRFALYRFPGSITCIPQAPRTHIPFTTAWRGKKRVPGCVGIC